MRRALIYIIAGSLFAQTASPAFAQRRGATGPRGGHVQHSGGAHRGATTYQGPHGGTAARAHGPHGSVAGVRGPNGAGAVHGTTGRYGGTAHVRNSYAWGGRQYYRPGWNANQVHVYGRGFVGYPGWRPYSTYGLTPGLAAFSSLAFLSAGMLIGTYAQHDSTVYVYVVNEEGQNVEYRVDSAGNIISRRVVY
jgi:hypothetical protein